MSDEKCKECKTGKVIYNEDLHRSHCDSCGEFHDSAYDNPCPWCARNHQVQNIDGQLVYVDYENCIFFRVPRSGEYFHTKWQKVPDGKTRYCGYHDHEIPEGTEFYFVGHRGYDYGIILDDVVCKACNEEMKRTEEAEEQGYA